MSLKKKIADQERVVRRAESDVIGLRNEVEKAVLDGRRVIELRAERDAAERSLGDAKAELARLQEFQRAAPDARSVVLDHIRGLEIKGFALKDRIYNGCYSKERGDLKQQLKINEQLLVDAKTTLALMDAKEGAMKKEDTKVTFDMIEAQQRVVDNLQAELDQISISLTQTPSPGKLRDEAYYAKTEAAGKLTAAKKKLQDLSAKFGARTDIQSNADGSFTVDGVTYDFRRVRREDKNSKVEAQKKVILDLEARVRGLKSQLSVTPLYDNAYERLRHDMVRAERGLIHAEVEMKRLQGEVAAQPEVTEHVADVISDLHRGGTFIPASGLTDHVVDEPVKYDHTSFPAVGYFVEVLDDHDGGSVWIEYDNSPETKDVAERDAVEVAKGRDNKRARVVKVIRETVSEVVDGRTIPLPPYLKSATYDKAADLFTTPDGDVYKVRIDGPGDGSTVKDRAIKEKWGLDYGAGGGSGEVITDTWATGHGLNYEQGVGGTGPIVTTPLGAGGGGPKPLHQSADGWFTGGVTVTTVPFPGGGGGSSSAKPVTVKPPEKEENKPAIAPEPPVTLDDVMWPEIKRHLDAAVEALSPENQLTTPPASTAPGEGTGTPQPPATTKPPEGNAASLDIAATKAFEEATSETAFYDYDAILIVFDRKTGAYEFRCDKTNVTMAIGLLHRAILSLHKEVAKYPSSKNEAK